MIRVLIPDDHPIVREGLKQILFETDDIRSEQTCKLAAASAMSLFYPLQSVSR